MKIKWKDLKIGQKMGIGFGGILITVLVIGFLMVFGLGGVVNDAQEVAGGNQLAGILAEMELENLNWVNKVNLLLTDERVTRLEVGTDDHEGNFGKWLYGERRRAAEKLVPSIAPFLKEIEESHAKLYRSAIAIKQNFKEADPMLPGFLAAKEVELLSWAAEITSMFFKFPPDPLFATDRSKSSLGRWLYGEGARGAVARNPELGRLIEAVKEPHKRLYESAIGIKKVWSAHSPTDSLKVYEEETLPALHDTSKALNKLKEGTEKIIQGSRKANRIYSSETLPALQAVQTLFGKIRNEVRNNILTDEAMLSKASGLKRNVIIGVSLAVAVAYS